MFEGGPLPFHLTLFFSRRAELVPGMSIFIHGHVRPQPASIQLPVSLHVLVCVWYIRSLSMKCLVRSWRWRFMTKTQIRMISWAGIVHSLLCVSHRHLSSLTFHSQLDKRPYLYCKHTVVLHIIHALCPAPLSCIYTSLLL